MKLIPWVDPYTNEPLNESENSLTSGNSKYEIIDGLPKFVKENKSDPQYDIEKCFSYQWTESDFGQPEKFFDEYIKQRLLNTI